MVKKKFNTAAGWLYVYHPAPMLVPECAPPMLFVPPGLVELYQQFYGSSVEVIANEMLPT